MSGTCSKRRLHLSIALLVVSIGLYMASLSMNVARVIGTVEIDDDGVTQMVSKKLAENTPIDRIAGEVTTVIQELIEEKFPMVANPRTFKTVSDTVTGKLRLRGQRLMGELLPSITIEDPPPKVRNIMLFRTIHELFEDGEAFLGLAILMFTIFFPVTKYTALVWILMTRSSAAKRVVLRWLKSWGQWSMGDVFVIAFMVVFMKINTSVISSTRLAQIRVKVEVLPGLYLFAASVVLAMIVSMMLTRYVRELAPDEAAVVEPQPSATAASRAAGRASRAGRRRRR